MAFVVVGNTGITYIASVVSDESYDPVFDTDMPSEFLFQLLPSFYRNFLEDKELFQTVWSGFMQAMSAELLHLHHVNYAKSLRDVPVISQRKWIKFDLIEELDFTSDPGLTTGGQEGRYTYDADADVISGVYVSRSGLDTATRALRARCDQDASLSWSAKVNVSAAEAKSSALFGYFDSESPTELKSALCAAVIGNNLTDDTPTFAVLHVSPTAQTTLRKSAYPLQLGVDYRLDSTYTSRTAVLRTTLTEVRALKTSGASGTTDAGTTGDVYTALFRDDSVSFNTLSIVAGDLLVYAGSDYTITAVAGPLLTVTPALLPVGASNLSYEVRGEVQQASLSLDLVAEASDPTFEVDQFGTSCMDVRRIISQLFTPVGDAQRAELSGVSSDWQYTDPTVSDLIISLPRLQDVPTNPTTLLFEGTDYNLVTTTADSTTIELQEPPASKYWAEFVGYDEGFIQNNFGSAVELTGNSTDSYKAQVRGLFYAYFQGPTLRALQIGVHILLGLPIADVAGTVEAINTGYSGTLGQITVAGRQYFFPLSVGTSLQVGQEVGLFEPLSNGVEIVDYLTDPTWWLRLDDFKEIQKYHSFAVRLNQDAFEPDTLQFAANFVGKIKPTWKTPFFIVFKALIDELLIDDDLALTVGVDVVDPICGDVLTPTYDSYVFEGADVDFLYDQGQTAWDITSASMRATATPLTGTAAVTNGSAASTGTGTAWDSEIGLGAQTDTYVGLALYTTGSGGETTAGSNVFTDPTVGAFADLVARNEIVLGGVGTFTILSITDDNTLVLDEVVGSTGSAISWNSTGRQLNWAEVTNVASATSLTFTSNATIPSGTYVLALLDIMSIQLTYDQFQESCPEEEVVFEVTYTATPPATTQQLTGTVDFPNTGVQIQGTGTSFDTELGLSDFIQLPSGTWHQPTFIFDADTINVTPNNQTGALVGATIVKATQILTGTYDFTNGSDNVPTSTSQVGLILPGYFIQAVPTPDSTDPASAPVVTVIAVSPTALTLSANYTGDTVATTQAIITRQIGAVTLPLTQTTTQDVLLDGSLMASSTLLEPTVAP